MKNIILMGLPGAGKGTQAEMIVDNYNIAHISTGDMFREAMAEGTKVGLEAKSFIDAGNLVPDEVTAKLVEERLGKADTNDGYILDGFPRTTVQAEMLESITANVNKPLQKVINIEVDPKLLVERLSGRFICRDCGATYHKVFNPTKVENTCDRCGGHNFYQREDDKPEVVKKRIEVNLEMNTPLIDFYREKGLLVSIDGTRSRDEVFADINEALSSLN
ncbi:adenylate kinase [Holzapfeliella sp. He02]|uniref:Adenylate kinase n=1 Tax=Holzapfeliella saturejae TaxID=3082953 RepID=A0ABU8SFE8_9LACO